MKRVKKTCIVLGCIVCLISGCSNIQNAGREDIPESDISEESIDSVEIEEKSTNESDVSDSEITEESFENADDSEEDLGRYNYFVEGKEKASVDAENSECDDVDVSTVFNDDKYSISDIAEELVSNMKSYERDDDSSTEYRLIDCGDDGNKELVVTEYFIDDYQSGAYIQYIVKDEDGSLVIPYFAESYDGSYTRIFDNGFVEKSGNEKQNVSGYSCGYLDANVKWHFYYKRYYYLDTEAYLSDIDFDIAEKMKEQSSKLEDLQVESFYFDEEGNGASSMTNYYLASGESDKSIYEPDSEYKKMFDMCGAKTCTDEEIQKKLDVRKKEISLDEKIIEEVKKEQPVGRLL